MSRNRNFAIVLATTAVLGAMSVAPAGAAAPRPAIKVSVMSVATEKDGYGSITVKYTCDSAKPMTVMGVDIAIAQKQAGGTVVGYTDIDSAVPEWTPCSRTPVKRTLPLEPALENYLDDGTELLFRPGKAYVAYKHLFAGDGKKIVSRYDAQGPLAMTFVAAP